MLARRCGRTHQCGPSDFPKSAISCKTYTHTSERVNRYRSPDLSAPQTRFTLSPSPVTRDLSTPLEHDTCYHLLASCVCPSFIVVPSTLLASSAFPASPHNTRPSPGALPSSATLHPQSVTRDLSTVQTMVSPSCVCPSFTVVPPSQLRPWGRTRGTRRSFRLRSPSPLRRPPSPHSSQSCNAPSLDERRVLID